MGGHLFYTHKNHTLTATKNTKSGSALLSYCPDAPYLALDYGSQLPLLHHGYFKSMSGVFVGIQLF